MCEQDPIIKSLLERHGLTFDTLPRGVILAACQIKATKQIIERWNRTQPPGKISPGNLTDVEVACGDYTPGRFAWLLSDVQVLPEPIPAKGSLGLWNAAAQIPGL